MQWVGHEAQQRYQQVVAAAPRALIALDYDGTLAPIVEDPTQARIHPLGLDVIQRLAAATHTVAIITGRPVEQVLTLAGLRDIAHHCPNLVVLGHYGNEAWTARDQQVLSPSPPPGIAGFMQDLPAVLDTVGVHPFVEHKGLAVALHTRTLDDPRAAYAQLVEPLTALAQRHGLVVEPGRLVLEARAGDMDKGIALHRLCARLRPQAVVFVGDDRGDLPAFAELDAQRARGTDVLKVCSGSPEEPRLSAEADVVLDGPDGVIGFLTQLADDAAHHTSK